METYIKEVNIRKFRALSNVNIEFSRKLNIICGQNGTSKSTILGVLAQICSFESEYINGEKSPLFYKTIGGKEFKSQFAEHFRFSKVFDKPKSKRGVADYWDIGIKVQDGYANKQLDDLRLDFTRRGNSLRLVLRGNDDRNLTHPVIFLGLRRLFPISERKNYTQVSFDYLNNKDNKERFIRMNSRILLKEHMDFYQDIASTNAKLAGSGAMPSSVVHGRNYDQDSVSIGEDNVGQIVQALESFRMLKEKYPNYKGGLLLIDEVDAALFPAAQKQLINVLSEYSEDFNIQVVMTSHSPTMIEYLDRLGEKYGKVIPLYYEEGNIKTGNKKFKEIESDLLVKLPTTLNIKIRCYFEDHEAIELFKALLRFNNNNDGKRLLEKKLEIMDSISMGGSNYIHLVEKGVPEFKELSLVILDGDTHTNHPIINLPFPVPPDQLLFEFLLLLDDKDSFWTKMEISKQQFFYDIANDVIKYFDINTKMSISEIRNKVRIKKESNCHDSKVKAREVFKNFYKHGFIQELLKDDNKNPFDELVRKSFDITQGELYQFIKQVKDNADSKIKLFYQS